MDSCAREGCNIWNIGQSYHIYGVYSRYNGTVVLQVGVLSMRTLVFGDCPRVVCCLTLPCLSCMPLKMIARYRFTHGSLTGSVCREANPSSRHPAIKLRQAGTMILSVLCNPSALTLQKLCKAMPRTGQGY